MNHKNKEEEEEERRGEIFRPWCVVVHNIFLAAFFIFKIHEDSTSNRIPYCTNNSDTCHHNIPFSFFFFVNLHTFQRILFITLLDFDVKQ